MSWGSAFRNAWDHATSAGRAAAREAALGPDKAAGALSDALAHTLQRMLFAAQDLHRIQLSRSDANAPAPPSPAAQTIRRAMDDIRHARVPAEKSERALQQAVRAALEQAASMPPGSGGDTAEAALPDAARRFAELQRRLAQQLADLHQAMLEQSNIGLASRSDKAVGLTRNVDFAAGLGQAIAAIDTLFLPNKSVDDPTAMLPCD